MVARRPAAGRPAAPAWRAGGWPSFWPLVAGLALGLLAVGPALAPGYILSYDMVFGPRLPLSAATLGLAGGPPRAVPSDAVLAALSAVLPADLLQKVVLVGIITASCAGAALLLRRRVPLSGQLAAGVCYAWNPYVAERLIMGHWALLLGYAALPWIVRAVRAAPRVRAASLAAALLPAAIGGFEAVGICALAAVPVALAADGHWTAGRTARARRLSVTAFALVVASLPWLIPALAAGVRTDPDGALAFAARPDTPFGGLGSLLLLGGIWNAQAVPRGYGGAGAAAWLVVVVIALAGYLLLGWGLTRAGAARAPAARVPAARAPAAGPGGNTAWLDTRSAKSARRCPTTRRTWGRAGRGRDGGGCPGLGIAALAGLGIAAIGLTGTGRSVLAHLIEVWPGFAVLRDGQQYLAPLALAEAVGLGLAAGWVVAPGRRPQVSRVAPEARGPTDDQPGSTRTPGRPDAGPGVREPADDQPGAAGSRRQRRADRRARGGLAAMAVAAPVLLLPGLAWGAAGRLHATAYPADWLAARRVIDAGPGAGAAVLLPWAAYRRPAWNGGTAVLDPWTKLLRRSLIWNDALRVGSITVAAEDPAARRLAPAITAPGPLTGRLRAAGVRYVIIDAGPLLRAGRLSASRRDGCLAARARLPGAVVVTASADLVVFRLAGPGAKAAKGPACPTAGR